MIAKRGRGRHRGAARVVDGQRPARSSTPTASCSPSWPPATATSASPTTTTSAAALDEDPDFPVAPAWPDQDGAGAHANVSGAGVVTWTDHRDEAIALLEYLTSPPAQERSSTGSEFAANPAVPPPAHIADWADVKIDPIDVDEAGPAARGRRRAHARGRLELTEATGPGVATHRRPRPPPADRAPARRRLGGRRRSCIALARRRARCVALPASFVGERRCASTRSPARCCPDALRTSVLLAVGVGGRHARSSAAASRCWCRSGTSPAGGGSTGRWCCHGDARLRARVRRARPVRAGAARCSRTCSATACASPGCARPAAPSCILTAVLYPYVYVLGRSAFLGQSRQAIEAARSLGRTYGQAVRQVALPLARPALAAGVALAVMEALADFGTVDLLGVQALTSAIYRVWNGAFDQDAGPAAGDRARRRWRSRMLAVERVLRGRARYHQALGRGDAVAPVRLRGWRGWLATACPAPLLLAVVRPARRPARGVVGRDHRRRHRRPATSATPSATRCCSASSAAAVAVLTGDGRRLRAAGAVDRASAASPPGSPPSATPCPAPSSRSRSTCRWCGSTAGSSTPPTSRARHRPRPAVHRHDPRAW